MKLHTRLTITYSLVISLVSLGLALFFWQYNIQRIHEKSYSDLQVLSENMSKQFEEAVRPMEFISEFLLSDSKTLSAIYTVTNGQQSLRAESYATLAKIAIRGSLISYCIDENFHRVNFFTEKGDFLSSNVRLESVSDGDADQVMLPALARVDAAKGKPILLSPHRDPWDKEGGEMVFSLVRAVRTGSIKAYLEVQRAEEIFDYIFEFDNDDYIQIASISQSGELFFSQLSQEQNAWLLNNFPYSEPTHSGEKRMIGQNVFVPYYSEYTGIYTIAVQSSDAVKKMASDITIMTLFTFFIILLISSAFVYWSAKRLTEPIRLLTKRMEETSFENMDKVVSLKESGDEIVMLSNSYNQLMFRLNQSMQREKQLNILQVQAAFDALQAQVNPHFLYNILNVIAYRGIMSGDETICDICDNLASMLRFSTGTAQRIVSIKEELEYVSHYLYLLKTRYQDKLQVSITIDELVQQQSLPKIVIQQIVENAITHGFHQNSGIMQIEIKSWVKAGNWYIKTSDNGSGFDGEALEKLRHDMEEIQRQAKSGRWKLEMEIGGMGLLNAYARMLLLFQNDFIFKLYNEERGNLGAVVLIGAPLKK